MSRIKTVKVRLLRPHSWLLVLIFYCWLNQMVIFLCLIHPHPFVMLSSPISLIPLFLALCVLLLFSGDFFIFGRVARRPPSSTVDGGVLSRLLTPTQASLARSKSAATLSADGKDAPGNLGVEEPDREEGQQQPVHTISCFPFLVNVVTMQPHQPQPCCRTSSLRNQNSTCAGTSEKKKKKASSRACQ